MEKSTGQLSQVKASAGTRQKRVWRRGENAASQILGLPLRILVLTCWNGSILPRAFWRCSTSCKLMGKHKKDAGCPGVGGIPQGIASLGIEVFRHATVLRHAAKALLERIGKCGL